MARDARVVIRLTDEVKDNFQEIAESYGMTISSLGSYVIGQWVSNQINVVKPLQDKMINSFGDDLKNVLISESGKELKEQ